MEIEIEQVIDQINKCFDEIDNKNQDEMSIDSIYNQIFSLKHQVKILRRTGKLLKMKHAK
jgi:hypothetical protein